MKTTCSSFIAVTAFASVLSCRESSEPKQRASLNDASQIAQIGTGSVARSLVEQLAAARGTPPSGALALLVDDLLAAEGARARGFHNRADVKWALTSTRARITVSHLRNAAVDQGPPTRDEVEEVTRLHWQEVRVPEQIKVVHAIVLRPEKANSEQLAKAQTLATEMHEQLAKSRDAEDFLERARTLSRESLKVVAETLPPFVEDGRSSLVGDATSFDPTFVSAAFALREPGGDKPRGRITIRVACHPTIRPDSPA